ncbi:carbohydrate-binding module family 1 protein [Piromyces sp. E2]|nr:carbohydrate-binding module family 1 protein [Piromyces sp. E2]|eukprot:OUM65784.1 carbohydrate-binding module family 1 protein [Piromyces sp. E2]
MKTISFLVVLVGLISNIYSYVIDNKYYPQYDDSETINYQEIGYPEVEVVTGPKHFANKEKYIDVLGTVDNYMKKYYPTIEYKVTETMDKIDFARVRMVQLYNGVEIKNSIINVDVDPIKGNILETTVRVYPEYEADEFEDRGEYIDEVKYMFEYINKLFYDGKLDLSGATFMYGSTSVVRNVPFNDPRVTRLYYDFHETGLTEVYSKAVWEFEFKSGLNVIKVYLNDKDGELLYISYYSTASDVNVGKEIDFDSLLSTPITVGPMPPKSPKTTTTTKAIPGIITTTTTTKQVPKNITTTTTTTKQVPKNITTTTTTKQIPKIITTTTTTTKQIPKIITTTTTSTKQQIPKIITTTTTSTKQVPKNITTTTTTTKQIPKIITTTTTSTKQIPKNITTTTTTTTKQIPKIITTTTTTTKQIPKIITTTTTTTTKQIPKNITTTTTTSKNLPCKNVSITVTVQETVTVKETITVTNGLAPTNPPQNCAAKWGQCGGIGFNGPTCCQTGSTCREINSYYSQCL